MGDARGLAWKLARAADPAVGLEVDQRSGGSLPSLKPGEILGAGALAHRARLSALAEGGRAVGITIACPAIRLKQQAGVSPASAARPGRLPSSRAFCLFRRTAARASPPRLRRDLWGRRRLQPRQGRAKRIEAWGVGKFVAFDEAADYRCYRGQLVVREVNCRHGPVIIGRDLFNRRGATCLAAARLSGVYSRRRVL
jgi:hypothetical protein